MSPSRWLGASGSRKRVVLRCAAAIAEPRDAQGRLFTSGSGGCGWTEWRERDACDCAWIWDACASSVVLFATKMAGRHGPSAEETRSRADALPDAAVHGAAETERRTRNGYVATRLTTHIHSP
jgi:hypothetical protein